MSPLTSNIHSNSDILIRNSMVKNLIFKLLFLVTGTLRHLRHWSKPNCAWFHGKKWKNNCLLSSNSASKTRSHKQKRTTKQWDMINNIRDCWCIMTILKQWWEFFVSTSTKDSFRKEQGEGLNISLVEVYEKLLLNASKWWRLTWWVRWTCWHLISKYHDWYLILYQIRNYNLN